MSLNDKIKALLKKHPDKMSEVEKVVEQVKAEEVKPEEQKFVSVILEDGTEIMVEPAVEIGAAATMILSGEPEPVPVPDGPHKLEDGSVIVTEAGVVVDIPAVDAELEDSELPQVTETERQAKKEIERVETERIFKSEHMSGLMEGYVSEKVAELMKPIVEENKTLKESFEAQEEKYNKQDELIKDTFSLLEKVIEEPVEEPLKTPKKSNIASNVALLKNLKNRKNK